MNTQFNRWLLLTEELVKRGSEVETAGTQFDAGQALLDARAQSLARLGSYAISIAIWIVVSFMYYRFAIDSRLLPGL